MISFTSEVKSYKTYWNSTLDRKTLHQKPFLSARRNSNFFISFTLILIFLVLATLRSPFSIIASVNGVVVGIDFGDHSIKAVFVSPGKQFETLLSSHSKRKIPNGITFETVEQLNSLGPTAPTRIFGEDVESYSTKRFQTSFSFPSIYLGQSFSDVLNGEKNSKKIPGINCFQHFYPFEYIEDDLRGTWKFRVSPNVDMFAEEITAHILWYIKDRILNTLELEDSSIACVLAIPCSFTQRQRQSLSDAAQIAGWDLLGMVHTSLAAAIQMALDQKVNGSQNILFYSLGSQRIDAGIVHIDVKTGKNSTESGQSMQLLSCMSMEGYGGQYIDLAVANEMAEKFEQQHGISLKENPKALKRILRQTNRVKHLLSANKDTMFVVESLFNGLDLKVRYSRTELEHALLEMGFLEKLNESVVAVLQNSNLTMSDIDAVELLGGAWRIPWIRGELQRLFAPKELGQHLNSDEAPARGAAFMAANRSVSYRVRPIQSVDIAIFAYPISLEYIQKNVSMKYDHILNTSKLLLKPTSKLSGIKKFVMQAEADLKITIFENDLSHPLDTYTLTGITEAKTGKYKELPTPNVIVLFKVNPAGVIQAPEAYAVFEEVVQVPVVTTVQNSTTVTNENENNSTNNETTTQEKPFESLQNATEDASEAKDTFIGDEKLENSTFEGSFGNASENSNHYNDSALKDSGEGITNATSPTSEEKKVLHKVKLRVERTSYYPVPLSVKQKKTAIKTLKEYNEKDYNAEQLATLRNTFESYIYQAKFLLQSELYMHCSEEQARTALFSQLDENEEWLYENSHANYSAVNERLSALKNALEPIAFVAEEHKNRPGVIKTMNNYLASATEKINKIVSSKPWLSSNLTESALNSLKELNAWWEEVQRKQLTLPPSSHPSFTKAEIDAKMREQDISRTILQAVPPPQKNSTAKVNTVSATNETKKSNC